MQLRMKWTQLESKLQINCTCLFCSWYFHLKEWGSAQFKSHSIKKWIMAMCDVWWLPAPPSIEGDAISYSIDATVNEQLWYFNEDISHAIQVIRVCMTRMSNDLKSITTVNDAFIRLIHRFKLRFIKQMFFF